MFNITDESETAFSSGDFVMCINDTIPNESGFLRLGTVYEVVSPPSGGAISPNLIYLRKDKNRISGGWFSTRFRKHG